ncbi:MAG: hypothetical protein JWL72_4379 [Ilumatobacteraceae bacterium]|nr:hypothetical protein [Ilumatobacteraceae bacterium]
MSESRSLLWRPVPWLFPFALILVGLVFVATSLSGTDHPDDVAAPPNVHDITVANAAPWALRQVLPGTTSSVVGVLLVSSSAATDTTYSVRAVIGRIDSPVLAPGATVGTDADTDPNAIASSRTVVTCVRWTVDVSNGTIVEHGASQLSNDPGRHDLGANDRLVSACRAATFAG